MLTVAAMKPKGAGAKASMKKMPAKQPAKTYGARKGVMAKTGMKPTIGPSRPY